MKNTIYFQDVFIHYIQQMLHIIEKCQGSRTEDFNQLLRQRLSTDMFPMGQQFFIAASFAMRACCWLRDLEVIKFNQESLTTSCLVDELKSTLVYIQSLSGDSFPNWENKIIPLTIGQRDTQLTGRELVDIYAIPNFIFHISMGYAILRQQGLEIGKGDFDGLHAYEPGFSFL